jgi:tetratricopeptide (TPR) repeat protein
MERAWDVYVKKYGFTPKNPITVELFTERQHYGARTIGLPELGAQGTCFGELITAMSPASAEANWELVLSHELAHVFHLQLSNGRVPRWFTEGLAEYETNIVHPYWKREYALEIFQSMQRGEMWKISELSAAFTRPNRENGVVIAYQQSSLVIAYLVDTYGFPKIVEALKMFGAGKKEEDVFPTITGKKLEQLDEEFKAYLHKRYSYYDKGFLFDKAAHQDLAAAQKHADAKPQDAAAQAELAAVLLATGKEESIAQAKKALALDPKNALAGYVLAEGLWASKDDAGARKQFEALLAQGTDGYDIRFALGQMAAKAGDLDEAGKQLAQAKKWDPDEGTPYTLLMQLYEAKDKREELLKEAEGYLDVEEHNHDAARLLIDRFSTDKRWVDIIRVAPRVIGITPMEPFVHQQYGIALADQKRPKEAIFELESALVGGVRRPANIRVIIAKQYLTLGDKSSAKTALQQALKDDPNNAEAAMLLKEAG